MGTLLVWVTAARWVAVGQHQQCLAAELLRLQLHGQAYPERCESYQVTDNDDNGTDHNLGHLPSPPSRSGSCLLRALRSLEREPTSEKSPSRSGLLRVRCPSRGSRSCDK